jgi:four helix bundle protein
MTIQSFRDLKVWQRAMDLTLALYKLTQTFPREEIYGLTSQLRRAGVSVASNIAEGFGRRSRSDYRSYLCKARGSVLEIQTQLEIARQLGYGDPAQIANAEAMADESSRMLSALIEKLGVRAREAGERLAGD